LTSGDTIDVSVANLDESALTEPKNATFSEGAQQPCGDVGDVSAHPGLASSVSTAPPLGMLASGR
jgi:hypothetical protein